MIKLTQSGDSRRSKGQTLLDRFRNKGSFLAQLAALTSGTVIAQAIAVLVSPVVTRLYLPEEMGLAASVMAIVNVLGVVAAGRYDMAVVLPDSEDDALTIGAVGVIIAAVLGAICFLFFGTVGPHVAGLIGLGSVPRVWLLLVGPILFLVGLELVTTRYNIRLNHFRSLAATQVVQQASTGATKVVAGLFGVGVGGLFAGNMLGHVVRSGGLLLSARKSVRRVATCFSLERAWSLARRYKRFPLIDSWSGFLNRASTQLPVLLFASVFSPAVAGFYALSHRVMLLPMSLLGGSVAQIFLDRAAKARGTPAELGRLSLGIYARLLLFGAIALSVVTFYGDHLFGFVFGPNWDQAGLYSRWMSLWMVAQFSMSPLGVLFSVLEKHRQGLIWNIVLVVVRIGTIVLGSLLTNSDTTVIAVYALTGVVAYFLLAIHVLHMAGVRVSRSALTILSIVGPVFAAQGLLSLVLRPILGG